MGQYHILALTELWDVDLVGIVDVDCHGRSRWPPTYGTRAFRDHRELAGLVDVATVAVPTERHFDVARDLLEAGVHVLVEKPMTPTLEEAKELFRVARAAPPRAPRGPRRALQRRRPGAAEDRRAAHPHRVAPARAHSPRASQNDSVVMDLMIHDIDIVLGLVDSEPRKVTAVGSLRPLRRPPTWPMCRSSSTSGAMATITASRATEEKIRTLAITQPDAYIVLDYADQDIEIHRRAAQEYTVNRESIRYRQASFVEHLFVHKDNPLKLEIRHLIVGGARGPGHRTVDLAEAEDLRSLGRGARDRADDPRGSR